MKWTSPINWLVFDTKIKTFWFKVTVMSRKFKSNPKFKSHRFHKITLKKKSFETLMRFQQPKKRQNQIGHFRPLATLKSSV